MPVKPAHPPVALIVGAGDATGGAIARRFAREGYTVCATRRSREKLQPLLDRIQADGGTALGFGSDARKEEEVVALVEAIETVSEHLVTTHVHDNHGRTDDHLVPFEGSIDWPSARVTMAFLTSERV